MPVSRTRKTRRPTPGPAPDARSYPDTSLSPNTYEGRIQMFGNVLGAAKYGEGRRRRAGAAILAVTVALLLLTLLMTLVGVL